MYYTHICRVDRKFTPQRHFLRAVAPIGLTMILCEVHECDNGTELGVGSDLMWLHNNSFGVVLVNSE